MHFRFTAYVTLSNTGSCLLCCDLAVKNDSARVENVGPVTSFDKLNFTDGIYIYLSEHVTR